MMCTAQLLIAVRDHSSKQYTYSAVSETAALCSWLVAYMHNAHIAAVLNNSVFMTEAVSLSALATVDALPCPKPLHLGKLPKVGDIGPGKHCCLPVQALLVIMFDW
jgi:hypothetical protein